MALWGGRFKGESDPLFREFNDSLPFDRALVQQDITGSIAWAAALQRARVLSTDEVKKLQQALREIAQVSQRSPELLAGASDEDVHSWVESRLIEKLGPLGKKLHTGRSRNDQVATDLRLWVRDELTARISEIRAAQQALVNLAEREKDTAMPGLTHLQHAQPVLLAHWCLAYVEMLDRDATRFADARRRANLCPLGAGALAGTAYTIDRAALAKDLGFEGPTANSLDSVSDRDFVAESLAAAALCAVHLSRLAEDLIIFSSQEFALVEMSDTVTSGSSLMPQKKNPDAAELIRGKCGRIIGAQVSLLVTLKGLPLAYNKDMQEDKEPIFDAMRHLSMCLRMTRRMLCDMQVDRQRCDRAAMTGYTNATELADYLVHVGVSFRDGHEIVGRIVRHAMSLHKPLESLPLDELKKFEARIGPDVFAWLSLERALSRRDVVGGTAPRRVAEAIAAAKARLTPAAAS